MSNIIKKEDKWAYFDGSSSYIQYDDNDVFSFTDGVNDLPFEIEFDFITNSTSGTRTICYKTGTGAYEWVIRFTTILLVRLWIPDASAYIGVYYSGLIINTPYHVKITYDGSKLWSGIKIYFSNILQTVSNSSSGVYTGMVNGGGSFYVGSSATSYFFNGYLRNLKIKKNNQLVFFAPLQDTTAVSKDVIGGLVHSAGTLPTVVNKLENEISKNPDKWSYFDGATSYIQYADNDIFSFTDGVNDIPFEVEFDMVDTLDTNYRIIVYKGAVSFGYEYSIRAYLTTLQVRLWSNGSSSVYIGASIPISKNTNYHVKISYDGSQLWSGIKMYLNNIEITTTNVSSGSYVGMKNCVVKFNVGTSESVGTYNWNGYLRNLKITKNNQLVFHAPLQDTNVVSKDLINGLTGSIITNVSVINKDQKISKNRNLWAYFQLPTGYIGAGSTSTFGWMNNGIFRVEFDCIIYTPKAGAYLLDTSSGVASYGFIIANFYSGGISKLQILWTNNTGSYLINNTGSILSNNTPYRIIFQGNGIQYRYIEINLLTNIVVYDSGWINRTFTPNSTTGRYLWINGANGTIKCAMKNVKFYESADTSNLKHYFPLTDNINISKDIVGNLNGVKTGTISVIDI